ncbi:MULTISPECIES: hypothetical protein [Exiguobacterium]|uniref:hypothetical protein n=1 Tax=Exiguobacterium TaxID=33986 RepID=UPI001BE58638|nr:MULTISPECIES: hypothetical protein [Exiguobacterium]MCT4784234.1 hypothetical protein [Exiguobacterium himgiriensis]
MRAVWTSLLLCTVLSGCGTNAMNAIEMRPLAATALKQVSGMELPLEIKEHILTYCEKQPTEILPTHRAKVSETTYVHPVYEELGSKTVSYWTSGEARYVSCANSYEQFERTFEVEPIDELEPFVARVKESEARRVMTFEPESDPTFVNERFHIDAEHERVIPESVFHYETPDTGSLYITYDVKRNGRTLDRTIESGLFVFKGERTRGYTFLTQLTDGRVSLQIGTEHGFERKVLPDIFVGKYVHLDTTEATVVLDGSRRQLLKRVIVSDEPIEPIGDESSLALSKRYGTVIEVWGSVRLPLTTTLMDLSPASEKVRLATYEKDGMLIHLDGPNTRALFDLLAEVAPSHIPQAAAYKGTLSLYERLSEQKLDVYVYNRHAYVRNVDTNETYRLDSERLEELLIRSGVRLSLN